MYSHINPHAVLLSRVYQSIILHKTSLFTHKGLKQQTTGVVKVMHTHFIFVHKSDSVAWWSDLWVHDSLLSTLSLSVQCTVYSAHYLLPTSHQTVGWVCNRSEFLPTQALNTVKVDPRSDLPLWVPFFLTAPVLGNKHSVWWRDGEGWHGWEQLHKREFWLG